MAAPENIRPTEQRERTGAPLSITPEFTDSRSRPHPLPSDYADATRLAASAGLGQEQGVVLGRAIQSLMAGDFHALMQDQRIAQPGSALVFERLGELMNAAGYSLTKMAGVNQGSLEIHKKGEQFGFKVTPDGSLQPIEPSHLELGSLGRSHSVASEKDQLGHALRALAHERQNRHR